MTSERRCPQCGEPLPSDAPDGMCPRCLLKAATGAMPTEGGAEKEGMVDIGDAKEIAARLPQFEILQLLGRGGMGVVYKVRQKNLDRVAALKILPPADALSPDFVARFSREARALAKLNHPNIVHIYEAGESCGLYYIVMEYVDGANLREILAGGLMQPEVALPIVRRICDALEYAHGEGLVHRDIKPENLLVDAKGRVKIADFGLAKLLRREPLDLSLTLSGISVGTMRYMAPEQMERPESVDHRADLYSLGVVIYEMLTGELPLGRFELPSQKVPVDVRLDQIVLHALERDVRKRYQHASEVRDDVHRVSGETGAIETSKGTGSARSWTRAWWMKHRRKVWYGGGAAVVGSLAVMLLSGWSRELNRRAALHNALPELGVITNGVGARFTVPAGQVVTFEIVTRRNGETVTIPHMVAYAVAPAGPPLHGVFRWSREPNYIANGVHRKAWRIDFVTSETGKSSSGGLDLPPELDPQVGAMSLFLGLSENEEKVHWMGSKDDEESLPANGMIGVRVKTRTHGMGDGGAVSGIGTLEWWKRP